MHYPAGPDPPARAAGRPHADPGRRTGLVNGLCAHRGPTTCRSGSSATTICSTPAPIRCWRPLGALSGLRPGERIVSRILLRSLGPGWSRHYQEKLGERPGQPQRTQSSAPPARGGPDPLALTVLGLAGFGFFQGYSWLQSGEIWNLAALCAGAAVALLGGGWAWRRWNKGRNRYFEPQLVKEKISRIAFEGELEVTAVLPDSAAA